MLNGKEYTHNWIDHSTIMEGGRLILEMDSIPGKQRGILPADRPFSLTKTGTSK